ncbi:hypothetical protein RJ639_039586 [Escallonia herrerae]|uniref:Uncharacterized protein n=1 Tax=Escallonia herrerae TaxID=1293975 RepID=A0AA89BFV9_9ASTE|nr:hypothetical protein RJ639_039586 [Escallonia herrerae]
MSPPLITSLIPSAAAALFPPKPPVAPPPLIRADTQEKLLQHSPPTIISSRRAAALLSITALIPSLHRTPPAAAAFSIGISGPKDWLREQKRKASRFLLAPIDASRYSLNAAYTFLTNGSSDYADKDLEEIQGLLRSAARDCVPQERNSFVAFQANTGVEVCTFQLVVNNASSLLGDKDPVKLEAEAKLSDLIRSFSSLNGVANKTDIHLASSRYELRVVGIHILWSFWPRSELLDSQLDMDTVVQTTKEAVYDQQNVADALLDTISSLDKFEQGIKDCLEI